MLQFDVRDEHGALLCPACGFPDYCFADAYFEYGGERMGICPCCLWEPGFVDAGSGSPVEVLSLLREYRRDWNWAAKWDSPNDQPDGWDGRRQLSHLFEVAPHVR